MHQVATLMQSELKIHESHLGGLGLSAEHGFPKKRRSDGHSVHAAHEPSLPPNLSAVGVAKLVEPLITGQDVLGDPGLLSVRAALHDFGEGSVPAYLEGVVLQIPKKSPGYVKIGHRKNASPLRQVPSNGSRLVAHGEIPLAVSVEQNLWINEGHVESGWTG
jgi:hypothetical protein